MKADKLALVFFPAFDFAISPTHPEREERLLYTLDQLQEEGLFDLPDIRLHRPELATPADISRTQFCIPNIHTICAEQHFASTGGSITAAKLVLDKKAERAFALVRPPGHHALRVTHGCRGFCNINNEAITVDYLRKHYGLKRIAIIDTDCHHGDGTQDIFWHDPDVLFISIHQDGRTLYPGTGFLNEIGGPKALGRTINFPLAPQSTDADFLYVLEAAVLPILEHFQPEFIINSAGQDNHYSDPLTDMRVSALGYARLTELLKPDLSVLEGGYSIHGALPYVNLGIALALAGYDYSQVREPDYTQQLWIKQLCSKHTKTVTKAGLKAYYSGSVQEEKFSAAAYGKKAHIRHKDIYYDTDNINEVQREILFACPSCNGILLIESRVQGRKYACINAPFYACSKCLNFVQELEDGLSASRKFCEVFVQNNTVLKC